MVVNICPRQSGRAVEGSRTKVALDTWANIKSLLSKVFFRENCLKTGNCFAAFARNDNKKPARDYSRGRWKGQINSTFAAAWDDFRR